MIRFFRVLASQVQVANEFVSGHFFCTTDMAHTNEETSPEIKLRDNNNPSVDIAPKLCTM